MYAITRSVLRYRGAEVLRLFCRSTILGVVTTQTPIKYCVAVSCYLSNGRDGWNRTSDDGIKVRCLASWLRPNELKIISNEGPTSEHRGRPVRVSAEPGQRTNDYAHSF